MAKAGRPPNLRPHEIKINVPSDPLKNKVKRLYWALLEMEKKMSKDITSVRMKDYIDLLSAYEAGCVELRKKGYTGRYAKAGMGSEAVAETGRTDGSTTVGGDKQTSVGVGVPAPNPFA